MKRLLFFVLLLVIIPLVTMIVESAVFAAMDSQNYRIREDSVNVGGVSEGSTNYRLDQTIGEVGSGETESANYILKAGYQELHATYLSLTVPTSNLGLDQPGAMSLIISTTTNAVAGAVWNVKTDSASGYVLYLNSNRANALQDATTSELFSDYTETAIGVPETWIVGSGVYEFGFTVFGNDVSDETWGVGSACTNPAANNLKYRGFSSTSTILVASSGSWTDSSGTDTALCLAAGQNGIFAPSGYYIAEITATVITQ